MEEISKDKLISDYYNKVSEEQIPQGVKDFVLSFMKESAEGGYPGCSLRECDFSQLARDHDAECPIGERYDYNNIRAIRFKPKKRFGKTVKILEEEVVLVDRKVVRFELLRKLRAWLEGLGYTITFDTEENVNKGYAININWK